MSFQVPDRICRHVFDTARLMVDHPPQWLDANKKLVQQIACPPDCVHAGQLIFSRWKAPAFPEQMDLTHATVLDVREDVFAYESPAPGEMEWYLNFAHWDLFCSYAGHLFAQDEMQVAEHPVLGALREALIALNIKPFTVDINEPTPILIQGAQRRVAIATDANSAEDRPQGLYGNRFAAGSTSAIERACRVIDPPTLTNVIAMEAPVGGGVYSADDIVFILRTACTGFSAARQETRERGEGLRLVIHTGFWGCGAYGGSRPLMALLQILAARASGVDRLVFHTFDSAGTEALEDAREIWQRDLLPLGSPVPTDLLVSTIGQMNFEWGMSDGN